MAGCQNNFACDFEAIPDGVEHLKQVLNPKTAAPLNSMENLFASIELGKQ